MGISSIDCLMLLWMNNCIKLSWEDMLFSPTKGESIYSIFCKTCDDENGLKYFQFLKSQPILGDNFIHQLTKNNLLFRSSCEFGRMKMIRYLKEEFELTKKDAQVDNNYALRESCRNGYLPVVKYLKQTFGLTKEDAQADNNYALRWSCYNGHIRIVTYLKQTFGLTKEDAQADYNFALRWSCYNGHIRIVTYLKQTF